MRLNDVAIVQLVTTDNQAGDCPTDDESSRFYLVAEVENFLEYIS